MDDTNFFYYKIEKDKFQSIKTLFSRQKKNYLNDINCSLGDTRLLIILLHNRVVNSQLHNLIMHSPLTVNSRHLMNRPHLMNRWICASVFNLGLWRAGLVSNLQINRLTGSILCRWLAQFTIKLHNTHNKPIIKY